MCGLFGFFLNRPLREEDIELGRAGLDALAYRGPDAAGHWIDREAGVFLGHRRLSIIDLSPASNQPLERDGGVLSFNGELYNFQEIRRTLEARGATFSTRGDAEVLLRAWLTWGDRALDRFDGMFAFALYHDRQLHLVTDPFGEKPLYWLETPEGVYFASEAGVLARLLGIPVGLDEEDVAAFLGLGFLPAPCTGYRGLHRLPPATHLVVQEARVRSERCYWTPPRPVLPSGPVRPPGDRDIDRLHELILGSLRTRVYSDVPIGIFLSSGTDSSLVTAIAVKELGAELQALTVAFPDGRDESAQAAAVARHLGVPHTVIDSREDPAAVGPAFIRDLAGELNDNLTIAAARQIALAARPFMKVALAGVGGDEIFYGYGRYQLLYRYRHLFGLPAVARGALARLAGAAAPASGRLQTFRALFSANDPCRLLAVKNGMAWPWLRSLSGMERLARRLFPPDGLPPAIAARQFDLTQTMPASYILAMERGSMRASLEARTPYLNRRLVEATAEMDPGAFLAFGQKGVLKRILARYLPPALYDVPKRGFVFPHSRFLQGLPAWPPAVPGLPPAQIEVAWRHRFEPGWQKLAVRLAMLELWLAPEAAAKEVTADVASG